MYILAFVLVASGNLLLYAGPGGAQREGAPTLFTSEAKCEAVRKLSTEKVEKAKQEGVNLPEFVSACVEITDEDDDEEKPKGNSV